MGEFLIFCNLFTRKKPTKSSIHVKRDIYIKVNTSLCPKKLLKALLKEKALFPTKVLAGRPFFGNKGPKKSTNVSFPLFMLFMQQNPSLSKMEVLYSSYRIFSIIFDFIAQTDLFNSACHHHQSPSNQYSYYKFKLIRDNYSIIIVTLYI